MARKAAVRQQADIPEALTGEQSVVLAHLVAGKSQKAAAEAAGVSEQAVSRWMTSDALFVATLNAVRLEVWQTAADRLAGLAADALGTLEELLRTGSDTVRLRAAVSVLSAIGLMDAGKPNGETSAVVVASDWSRQAFIDALTF